jgi:hypothetical protein
MKECETESDYCASKEPQHKISSSNRSDEDRTNDFKYSR